MGLLEYREARKNIEELSKKTTLNRREDVLLREAERTVRVTRRFVLGGLTASGIIGSLIGFNIFSTTKRRKEEREEEELQTDQLIFRAENGFAQFATHVTPLIDQYIDNERLREELKSPFIVMEINKKNLSRNQVRFHREAKEQKRKGTMLENPYYFFYGEGEIENFIAGFSPIERIMELSPSFDPDNHLDMLVFYHELRHAAQDANLRRKIQSRRALENYLNFYAYQKGQKPRIILTEEGTAYAYEIEILNLLTHGKLKASVESGESIDEKTLREILNARENQNNILGLIVELAKIYYSSGGIQNGNLPKRFLNLIAQKMRTRGYEVYVFSTRGGVELYQE